MATMIFCFFAADNFCGFVYNQVYDKVGRSHANIFPFSRLSYGCKVSRRLQNLRLFFRCIVYYWILYCTAFMRHELRKKNQVQPAVIQPELALPGGIRGYSCHVKSISPSFEWTRTQIFWSRGFGTHLANRVLAGEQFNIK